MTDRLRVVVATALAEEHVAMIRQREPRLEIVYEPSLLPEPGINWMHRETLDAAAQARFDELLDTAEALYGVPDHSSSALTRTVAANPGLRWVHTIPAGGGQQIKAANLGRADLERIVFTTSAGVHATPLAEFAVFGVFAGAKEITLLEDARRRGVWGPRRALGLVADQTVVVVGLGSIGRVTAEKLAALGCRVVGVHRREVEAEGVAQILPVERLAEAVAEADAVVLALPQTAETDGMLSRAVLAAVKPGITVINVGRGSTVDEPALIEALQDGRVGLAVLDVTAVEPPEPDNPLWTLPNVILSPHSAAISVHESRLIAELFADNAGRFLDGRPMRNRVNIDEFY
jgi:phosphoglycerate dehydrogenase-like enzyme